MKHERICIVCGKHYSYCGVCGKYNPYEQWRNIYCDQECKDVYHTYCEFDAGIITKEEAIKKLENVKLPKGAPFEDELKAVRKKIK